ncbi:nucleotidyl transferase AbiEii/AbiGii toxin family protein [Sediminibacterium ginsengisoli]|uniref:nucleotidyl transferase AbiEii/AbiGii toxin family protein n=1 Tax=Sediminibacterium ginsengisoli TaxID=413434 RepID=UPI0015926295|nr:nucleotidyl transferase AbiEii/AbiGii toxin family protein [Sediminibacterium ginsengisoli]
MKESLGDLKDKVVFVGGATVGLYTDKSSAEARPTDDIDVVIELWSHSEYAAIDERLRDMGFVNDQASGIVCRYIIRDIIVDVMPTHNDVLGFSNRWYPKGFATAIDYDLGQSSIRIFSPQYFIATKLEAFKSRGNNDGRTSTDFEDIIFVLENNTRIWEDMEAGDDEVRTYLKKTFRELLDKPHFGEWIDSHAGYGSPPATYFIINQLRAFVDNK